MEWQWYRVLTDVLPNFLIILIVYTMLSFLKSASIVTSYRRFYDYMTLLVFGLILATEEHSGIFGMSRVSDLNDTIASFSAVITVIVTNEVILRER